MAKYFRFFSEDRWTTQAREALQSEVPMGNLLLSCTAVREFVPGEQGTPSSDWLLIPDRPVLPDENPQAFYPIVLRSGWIGQKNASEAGFTDILVGEQVPEDEGSGAEVSKGATFISVEGQDLSGIRVGDEQGILYEGGNAILFPDTLPLGTEYTLKIFGPGAAPPAPQFWTRLRHCQEMPA